MKALEGFRGAPTEDGDRHNPFHPIQQTRTPKAYYPFIIPECGHWNLAHFFLTGDSPPTWLYTLASLSSLMTIIIFHRYYAIIPSRFNQSALMRPPPRKGRKSGLPRLSCGRLLERDAEPWHDRAVSTGLIGRPGFFGVVFSPTARQVGAQEKAFGTRYGGAAPMCGW